MELNAEGVPLSGCAINESHYDVKDIQSPRDDCCLSVASYQNTSGLVKMRQTACLRFATPVATGSGSGALRRAPLALLPPIPLYRRLLRAHRHKLDPDERILGDQYIRSEFRAHRKVENPVHIVWTILLEEKCRRLITNLADWVSDRVAAVCTEAGG